MMEKSEEHKTIPQIYLKMIFTPPLHSCELNSYIVCQDVSSKF